MLTAETIQEILDGALEDELGYSKYDYKNKNTVNSWNGYSSKTVQSSQGEKELSIPRDRNGEYEPQLAKKYQKDILGIKVDDIWVSKITDKILPLIKERQGRSLQSICTMVIVDAVHYNVRDKGL